MARVLVLGEAHVDFVSIEIGVSLKRVGGFYKDAGGSAANTAVGLARQGVEIGFIGKTGKDDFGRYITEELIRAGVNTSDLLTTEEARTPISFASLEEDGSRDYLFYRRSCAGQLLTAEEVRRSCMDQCQILHLGSLCLMGTPIREAAKEAVRRARREEIPITFDPTFALTQYSRSENDKDLYREQLSLCSIGIMNESTANFLGNSEVLSYAARDLLGLGLDFVVITLGNDGCYYRCAQYEGRQEGISSKVKDKAGEGGAFAAGFLGYLTRRDAWDSFPDVSEQEIRAALKYGCAAKALSNGQVGASSAIPTLEDTEGFISQ